MKKIPSVFLRDPADMAHVTNEVNPLCQWVLDGEGVATRKFDGTCVMFDGARWWARREVKPGKAEPPNWIELDADPVTSKRMGWEPIEQSGFVKHLADAQVLNYGHEWAPGTYELIGPKINSNPEGRSRHDLIRHADAEDLRSIPGPRAPGDIIRTVLAHEWEGIVWHHPDGRMAKLKKRDLTTGDPT